MGLIMAVVAHMWIIDTLYVDRPHLVMTYAAPDWELLLSLLAVVPLVMVV